MLKGGNRGETPNRKLQNPTNLQPATFNQFEPQMNRDGRRCGRPERRGNTRGHGTILKAETLKRDNGTEGGLLEAHYFQIGGNVLEVSGVQGVNFSALGFTSGLRMDRVEEGTATNARCRCGLD